MNDDVISPHEGLPLETPAAESGEIADAGATETINPQQPLPENPPQTEELSTEDTQLPTEEADKPVDTGCDFCNNKEKYQSLTDDYVTKSEEKKITPWIEELALLLNKDEDTLKLWVIDPQHSDFTSAIKKLVLIQKLRLLEQSTGRFTHQGAIFLLDRLHHL